MVPAEGAAVSVWDEGVQFWQINRDGKPVLPPQPSARDGESASGERARASEREYGYRALVPGTTL